ncbi:MAG: hypothetical protein C4530_08035 [Desulfobacteraceae bacterium]|nr:MAG: hypothetical protein C4530_08035 [Desulfobacteraceae bacterium]
MSVFIDYRKELLEEISDLSPQQLEKIYRAVMFLKEEFMTHDEARYHTESWIQAEIEATEAYRQGGLKTYANVDEMVHDIVSETTSE